MAWYQLKCGAIQQCRGILNDKEVATFEKNDSGICLAKFLWTLWVHKCCSNPLSWILNPGNSCTYTFSLSPLVVVIKVCEGSVLKANGGCQSLARLTLWLWGYQRCKMELYWLKKCSANTAFCQLTAESFQCTVSWPSPHFTHNVLGGINSENWRLKSSFWWLHTQSNQKRAMFSSQNPHNNKQDIICYSRCESVFINMLYVPFDINRHPWSGDCVFMTRWEWKMFFFWLW